MFNIVLHEPGIALNTGNIGRTSVAAGAFLHLIRPYGFRLNEKEIKRAGMDYWEQLNVHEYVDYDDFCENYLLNGIYPYDEKAGSPTEKPKVWYATTKAKLVYTEASFKPGDFIMFGNESRGIPEEILTEHEETCIRIPMLGDIRSLNLANSAAIVLYEALRQNGFGELNREGHLHRLSWKS